MLRILKFPLLIQYEQTIQMPLHSMILRKSVPCG